MQTFVGDKYKLLVSTSGKVAAVKRLADGAMLIVPEVAVKLWIETFNSGLLDYICKSYEDLFQADPGLKLSLPGST